MSLRLVVAALIALTFACATGADPMPPRADPNPVPEEVKKHPGFNARNAQAVELPPREQKPAPVDDCARTCPEGQRCQLVHGLPTCVDD